MTTNNDNFQNGNNGQDTRILKRPTKTKRYIEEGIWEGEITDAEIDEVKSKYHDSGKRTVIKIEVKVRDDDGNDVVLYDYPTKTWSKQGNWYKILDNLDMLPAPGEDFDLDDLVGVQVKVMVENVTKGDKTYSNIVKMDQAEEKRAQDTDLDELFE